MPTIKPSFKPNKSLGEKTPTPRVLAYRAQLLEHLERLYKKTNKILKEGTNPDDMIQEIDEEVDKYIQTATVTITNHITTTYMDSVKLANKRLTRLGAPPAIVQSHPPRLEDLIKQGRDNLEDSALVLRGRLRQAVRLKKVMGYYEKEKS